MLNIDIVQEAAKMAGQHVVQEAERLWLFEMQLRFGDFAPKGAVPVESPAEAVFEIWFLADQQNIPYGPEFILRRQVDVEVVGQRYRFDFAVFDPSGRDLKLAIEIDGHTFHEKTLTQVTYRNRRDRALQVAGYTVFHFSFSELMTDPMRCVKEVWTAAMEIAHSPKNEQPDGVA